MWRKRQEIETSIESELAPSFADIEFRRSNMWRTGQESETSTEFELVTSFADIEEPNCKEGLKETQEDMQKENFCDVVEVDDVKPDDKEATTDYHSDDRSDVEDMKDGCCSNGVTVLRNCASSVIPSCISQRCGFIIKILVLCLYFVYFGFAMAMTFGDEGSIRLLLCTVFGGMFLAHKVLWRRFVPNFCRMSCTVMDRKTIAKISRMVRWVLYILTAGTTLLFLIFEVGMKKPRNLVSVGGLAFFILAAFFLSRKPTKINWHTIYWGMILQFFLALFILRTQVGITSVLWMTDRVNELLGHSLKASKFMFGKRYTDHGLIFGSLPMMFFINSLVGILYHYGGIQWFVRVVGSFLRWTLHISPAESICVAANLIVDAPTIGVAMKPYIELMSRSELYTVVISGQASVSGALLGIVSSFGISVTYLIPAAVMSAPASIVIAKLVYPDNNRRSENDKTPDIPVIQKYTNLYEAASMSAFSTVAVFSTATINLFVYFALLSLINSTLMWLGERVNISDLTFEFICSYLFFPLSAIMGVDIGDCGTVGKLIGYKIMGSTTLSYYQLATLVKNRHAFQDYMLTTNGTGSYQYIGDHLHLYSWNRTLEFGYISEKSEAIATYSLCGYCNFASIGMALGVFSLLIPDKAKFIAKISVIAMIWANVACFMTACFAGLLH